MTESTDRSRDEVDWTEVSQQLESLLTLAGQQVLADQRVRASYRGAQATSDVTAGTLRGLPYGTLRIRYPSEDDPAETDLTRLEIDLLSTRHGWEIRGELKVDKLRDVATRVEVLNWSSEEDLPHLARLMGGFVQACVPRIIWWLSS